MSSRRQLVLLSIALSLVVSACSGLRLSPVTAEPPSKWIPGKFIWHDLITHDVSAVKLFYAGVFGWKFEDLPGTERYTVIRHDGEMIGGIAFSDRKIDGKPISQWDSMISVPSVDRAVGLIRQGGGKVYAGPRDIADRGRLAIVGDTGADPAEVMTRPAVARTIEPRTDLAGVYDDAYAQFRALYPAIKEVL